jgi:hypothetical protein
MSYCHRDIMRCRGRNRKRIKRMLIREKKQKKHFSKELKTNANYILNK